MKIRVLIADDELLARLRIRQLLTSEPDFEVIGEHESGHEAACFIREHHPELVFLDIEMPEMNGLDVLRAFAPERRPVAIFVTAHRQHALEAFDLHAADYLLKPFTTQRFREALQKARLQLRAAQTENPSSSPQDNHQPPQSPQKDNPIAVKSGDRSVFIQVADLDYIEGAANYAILHVGTETQVLRDTLIHLEAKLAARRFLRINRSTIVNLSYVREIRRQSRWQRLVVLANGKAFPVTRGKREMLQRLNSL